MNAEATNGKKQEKKGEKRDKSKKSLEWKPENCFLVRRNKSRLDMTSEMMLQLHLLFISTRQEAWIIKKGVTLRGGCKPRRQSFEELWTKFILKLKWLSSRSWKQEKEYQTSQLRNQNLKKRSDTRRWVQTLKTKLWRATHKLYL